MYDTITVQCPKCGEPSEFQSKSGDCMLETYMLDDAPDDVLLGVNDYAPNRCSKCNTLFSVEISGSRPRRTLTARAVVWEGE
jgi:phage FluMu protein Com